MEIEKRGREAEIRSEDTEERRMINGYAAVYDSISEDLGGFREIILPGAFDSVLARSPDVRALVNHDTSLVIGRTTSETLRLESDPIGLRFTVDLPTTTYGDDLRKSVRRGDITGASFAFNVDFEDYDLRFEGEEILREIRNIASLYEVSVVTFPAYQATEVSARSLDAIRSVKMETTKKYRDAYLLKIKCELSGVN